ncbi:MAG: SGNH/GDSL hydrolase family protein [Gammaproteobacteria bacterium]|nr:MAG: SGNH/GDSL hydrolase family protein [Gammaproteobacteria bacterium]
MGIAAAVAAQDHTTRFLALGDSYTIGEGVAESGRWPVQLAAALRATHKIDPPEIVARTGWTTDELAAAMAHHTFHPPYALVTLLIGVNNQYRGRDLQNYRDQFRALLNRAIELAGGKAQRVIVVSIPDWGVTRFGRESDRDLAQIARELDAYNAANAQISQMLHVHYVDVTGISRDGGGDADMLVDDGLHPSAAMYRRWSEAILPVAQRALSDKSAPSPNPLPRR